MNLAMYIHRMASMVRKQVYLTPELDERLRHEAARLRRTEAEILREALAAHLGAHGEAFGDASRDSLWDLVGIGSSDRSDLSESVDDILYGPSEPR